MPTLTSAPLVSPCHILEILTVVPASCQPSSTFSIADGGVQIVARQPDQVSVPISATRIVLCSKSRRCTIKNLTLPNVYKKGEETRRSVDSNLKFDFVETESSLVNSYQCFLEIILWV
ncbi:hypothetical protein B9Z55_004637 [Caenorhabditis nigoni]|uniref:Uncharacterized protein n=1 Tax=Caenorhabditis nigoni TaxID=1611254 RepID=A0A2G5UXE0_9PELO|nr:hypothetical protein B9Z55_004637 [Caenorhabditis nigoni]